eukprot:3101977-Pleurochrysis_carterae.AAC.1
MHTLGVVHTDADGTTASRLAHYLCGLAGAHGGESAVGQALAAAARPEPADAKETQGGQAAAAAAGHACRAA